MKEPLSEDQLAQPLNEVLLHEAAQLKSDRKSLKKRLDKLEQSHEGVSEAVYQKVRSDYISQLNKMMERLGALKKDLEKEQRGLLQKKNLIEIAMKSRQEAIEESQLRHALGEFTATQHQEVIQRESEELKSLEAAIKTLSEGLERHRGIFEGEEWIPIPQPEAPLPPPRPSVAQATAPESTTKVQLEREVIDRVAEKAPSVSSGKKIPDLLIFENGKVTQTIPIDQTIHIGRSPSNEVVLKEAKVSRKHAEIQCVGGKYVLMDLESSNGTFIGGKKIAEQILQSNDEILIGNTKMVFKA